jgi:hypothetical protein
LCGRSPCFLAGPNSVSLAEDEFCLATLPSTKCVLCRCDIGPGGHRVTVTQTCCRQRDSFCLVCWGGFVTVAVRALESWAVLAERS